VTLSGGRITADEAFVEALVSLKLDTVPGVFAYGGEGYLRSHAGHDNFHVVKEIGGRSYDLFLKRHSGFEPKESFKLLMSESPLKSAGRREWDNIQRLVALGIPNMRPVAFGDEKRFLFLERRSFIITERIHGGVPMDGFIRENFRPGLSGEALRAMRALLWDLGDLIRKLHCAGFTHMDLYLCHVFVRTAPTGERYLHLIDLQRVARRWAFRRRWIVKDLAAVMHSARDLPLSRTDIARIFTAYLDGTCGPRDRGLVRAAIRRAARMSAR
jgi:heptose I phosphotransferase